MTGTGVRNKTFGKKSKDAKKQASSKLSAKKESPVAATNAVPTSRVCPLQSACVGLA